MRVWLQMNGCPLKFYGDMENFLQRLRFYLRTQTAETAVNGFKPTRIYYINCEIFIDDDFIAADLNVRIMCSLAEKNGLE